MKKWKYWSDPYGWDKPELWREKGDKARARRGRRLVADAMTDAGKLMELIEHVAGYRAAAEHMKIDADELLDRIFGPDWKKLVK